MLPVSAEFRAAIVAPTRMIHGRVRLEVLDTRAWLDNTKQASSEVMISRLHQLTNRERQPVGALVTCEPNYWRLDGSFVIPPRRDELPDAEVGWWSDTLCDAQGVFDPPQTLNITCGALYNAAGLTVTFDPAAGEWAADFTVTAYDGAGGIIYSEDVTDNTLSTYRIERVIPQFHRVELAITRWRRGHRRARVVEIDFGLIENYGEENLIDLSLINELDPSSATLPAGELRFKLDNADRRFNITNPQGLHYFLQRRQQVAVELGVAIGARVEYVPGGTYYLNEWKSDQGTMTASFVARDLIDLLGQGRYRRGRLQVMTAAELAADILDDAGVLDYSIDLALQGVQLMGCIPLTSHREALQLVAVAAGAVVRIDRRDKLHVERLPAGEPVAAITLDNAWSAPAITMDKLITAINVEIVGHRLRGNAEVYQGAVTVDGQAEVWIEYTNPCQAHQVSVGGGALIQAEHYAYASRLLVSGAGQVEISITADEMEQTRSVYTLPNTDPLSADTPQQTLQVRNPLVHTPVLAADVAAWLMTEAKRRLTYDVDWRQNPALEPGDIITIEDEFGAGRPARITRQEIEFAGYLSGRTGARGGGSP